jgi:hypothetical protein
MPAFTYLLEVLPRGGRGWATLKEPRTGGFASGTFGVLEAEESGLSDAAMAVMDRYRKSGLELRVCFWAGRRLNESLYISEISCLVRDDGTVAVAETIRGEAENRPEGESHRVRTDCPHAPHDISCGHALPCHFVHPGAACAAVRPACPACYQEEHPAKVPALVEEIRRGGELVRRCSSCEELAFAFDAGLVCGTCQWLVPDVNEELEDRFLANGGAFAPPPGSCAGCSQQMPGSESTLSFDCPRCGRHVYLTLDSAKPGGTITTMCPDSACGLYITVPASIWCQECGQHLRPPEVTRRLTLKANRIRTTEPSDVREDEDTRLARRLAKAANSAERRYSQLTDEQKNLLRDNGFLDSLISSPSPLADWVRDVVEIRAIGHEAHRSGGMRALRGLHQRVMELGVGYRIAARTVELYWDGIGDWWK